MKTIALLILASFTSSAIAECRFDEDIVVKEDYVSYSYECHREMGRIVFENETRKRQLTAYEELLKITRDQVAVERSRADQWQKLGMQVSSSQKLEGWGFFGAGMASVLLSAWALGQISK